MKGEKSFVSYTSESLAYSVTGMVFGSLIEGIYARAHVSHPSYRDLWVLGQLLTGITLLYLIERYIAPAFAADWQDTSPGIFFIAFYFGCQPSLVTPFSFGGSSQRIRNPSQAQESYFHSRC